MAKKGEALVTVVEASRAIGVSTATVWRLIQRGALPSVRRNGRRLIPARALGRGILGRSSEKLPPFGPTHPIFRLVGAARSGGAAPGARDKHAILEGR